MDAKESVALSAMSHRGSRSPGFEDTNSIRNLLRKINFCDWYNKRLWHFIIFKLWRLTYLEKLNSKKSKRSSLSLCFVTSVYRIWADVASIANSYTQTDFWYNDSFQLLSQTISATTFFRPFLQWIVPKALLFIKWEREILCCVRQIVAEYWENNTPNDHLHAWYIEDIIMTDPETSKHLRKGLKFSLFICAQLL